MRRSLFLGLVLGSVVLSLFVLFISLTAKAEDTVATQYNLHSFSLDMYEVDAEKLCKKLKPSYTWVTEGDGGFHNSACVADIRSRKGPTAHYLTRQPAFIIFDVHGRQVRNMQAVYFEPQEWLRQRNKMEDSYPVFQDRYIQYNGVDSRAPIYYSKLEDAYMQAYVIEADTSGVRYEFDRRHSWLVKERVYVVEVNQDKKFR